MHKLGQKYKEFNETNLISTDRWGQRMSTNKFVQTMNSVYEVDRDAKRIRRLTSNHQPTDRQSPDGEWDEFEDLKGFQEGQTMMIVWEYTGSQAKATRTSPVQSIEPVDADDES